MSSVAGVILAAGASMRLGRPKQLAIVGGETLVARALRALAGSSCARQSIGVVLGAHRDVIERAIDREGVEVIVNDAWSSGMASSVRAAARWAERQSCSGLLLTVCDQPHLDSTHLDALVAAFASSGRTVGSAYEGTIGVPAIFERARFGELAALEGDRGARALLRGDVGSVDWPAGAIDVDTVADLAALGR